LSRYAQLNIISAKYQELIARKNNTGSGTIRTNCFEDQTLSA